MTFRSFWEWRVAQTPDALFASYGDERWSYGQFDKWVNELANGFRHAGIGEGDHVALLLPSSLTLLRIQWALQKVGAVWVPINPDGKYPEIAYVLEHARTKTLITDVERWSLLTSDGLGHLSLQCFLIDGFAAGAEPSTTLETGDSSSPPGRTHPRDPMAIMYTSGSTGRPKGVVQPGSGYSVVAHAVARRLAIDAHDRWYCVMPLFHSGATHLVVGPAIAAGASIVLRQRFSRSAFWGDVREHGATAALLMPAMLSMLLTEPPRDDDHDNPLRVVYSHLRDQAFVDRFGVDVCPGWGMTETMGVGALTPVSFTHYRPQLIGRALPEDAEIKIADADGHPLRAGERGELCVRHPDVMLGYYRDPENTRRTIRDGWIHSGDIASMDEKGFVYFHGRIKNVIKRAGENVAGEEVESALMEHPAIEECVVIGIDDPIRTEEVYAAVRVREGSTLTESELVAWCRERLSDWKVPRYIRLEREHLPTLPSGKFDRLAIRASADASSTWDGERERREPSRPS
jgi:crotonobetaine/carnitine-CoA ligase